MGLTLRSVAGAAGSAPQSSAGPTTESTTSAGGRLTIEEAEAAMVAYVSDQEEPAVQTPTRGQFAKPRETCHSRDGQHWWMLLTRRRK